jgi:hypothetical protein
MPLPTGTWSAIVNGQRASLVISSVDASGIVSGTISMPDAIPISGLWDEISQKLTFGTASLLQIFSAHLFEDQFRMPGIVGGTVFTLAGSFTGQISATAPDPDRPIFGWYAQIGLP